MAWKETTSPKTFTSQPDPPYLTIDFWQKGTDLHKCIKARTSAQAFNEDDWVPATPAEEAKADAQAAKDDASDAKTEAADAKQIAEKTANYVFADSEGLHVSSEEGDASQGWNSLLSSQGMAVRDGQEPEFEIGSHQTSVQKWTHLKAKNPLWISSENGSVSITGTDEKGDPTESGIGIAENVQGGIDALISADTIDLFSPNAKLNAKEIATQGVIGYSLAGGVSYNGMVMHIGKFTTLAGTFETTGSFSSSQIVMAIDPDYAPSSNKAGLGRFAADGSFTRITVRANGEIVVGAASGSKNVFDVTCFWEGK